MSETVTFRLANAGDLPSIIALLVDDDLGQTRESGVLSDKYKAAFEAIEAQSGNEVIVGEFEGKVVATAQLTLIPNLTFEGSLRGQIEGVRVASSQRGRGTGEALLRWLIDRAKGQGGKIIQLTTNKARGDALRFYERLGFEASHEGMKLYL